MTRSPKHRSACAWAAALLIAALLLHPCASRAAWLDVPPALPSGAGTVIHVATEDQLQKAVAALESNTTIVIAPGTYRLTRTIAVHGPLSNVTIRGATTSRDDVVLSGPGMRNRDYGRVEHGIWAGGVVSGLTIANLTIREVYFHPIILNGEVQSPHIYNVHLVNGGQQLLKTNPTGSRRGIDNGIIEYSVFEYSPTSRDDYANAIQVLAGTNWIIRNNLIRNIRAPAGQLAGPAVLAWFSASGTIIEGNTFLNCQREIGIGLIARTPNDHSGGIVRNNFIYRDASVHGDVAIGVFDSPGTKVLHNSIYVAGSYPNAIEYRFPDTTGILIANNLTNRAISSRDGATGSVVGNYLEATLGMFVNAAEGNMRLTPSATAAIDHAAPVADTATDWKGLARPIGAAADIGADEFPGVPSR
jgi:hypothetical protein